MINAKTDYYNVNDWIFGRAAPWNTSAFQTLTSTLSLFVGLFSLASCFKYLCFLFPVVVDRCSVDNGGCAQICRSTTTSAVCSCRSGFTLNSDGRSCDGTWLIADTRQLVMNCTSEAGLTLILIIDFCISGYCSSFLFVLLSFPTASFCLCLFLQIFSNPPNLSLRSAPCPAYVVRVFFFLFLSVHLPSLSAISPTFVLYVPLI